MSFFKVMMFCFCVMGVFNQSLCAEEKITTVDDLKEFDEFRVFKGVDQNSTVVLFEGNGVLMGFVIDGSPCNDYWYTIVMTLYQDILAFTRENNALPKDLAPQSVKTGKVTFTYDDADIVWTNPAAPSEKFYRLKKVKVGF